MAFRSNITSLELVAGRIVLRGVTAAESSLPSDMHSLAVSVALQPQRSLLTDDVERDVVVGGTAVTGRSVRVWEITFDENPVKAGTRMLVLGTETFVVHETGIGDPLSLSTVTWSERVTLTEGPPTTE